MKLAELGTNTVKSFPLSLGSDLRDSQFDRKTAFSLLDSFVEKGGNLIDAAGSANESTIGAWLRERGNRDQVLVSSKLSFEDPGSVGGLSRSEILSGCEQTLTRLQTDRLDIYYADRDDLITPQEETMAALDALVKAGKVRILGAGNLPVWRIAQANTIARLNGHAEYQLIQQFYTYLRPRLGIELSPQLFLSEQTKEFARAYDIGLVASSALLSGAYSRDHKSSHIEFAGPDSDERMSALVAVSAEVGCSTEQVVIAWMLQSNPAVLPVVIASSSELLGEYFAALEIVLTEEQMVQLTTAGNPKLAEAWLQSK